MIRKKLLAWPALKREINRARAKRKKVVFTNGCFDLLHVGHLKVLKECRKRGDVLVLGLNSDDSVRRLKGDKRPLIPEKERAELMAGLACVDYVAIFKEDTPERLIELVRPDVLVKGGDWAAEQIVGRHAAKKVVRVPLVKGHSTSALIQRIVERYGSQKTDFKNHVSNSPAP